MKKSIYYIVGVMLIAGACNLAAGFFLPKLTGGSAGISSALVHVLDSASEEIVIFGSSVAQVGVRPDIIESHTGATCYNAGMGYQNMNYHVAVLKEMLRHHTPRMVLLGIDRGGMHSDGISAQITFLYPFYNKGHAAIDRLLEKDNPNNRWLLHINLYRYNLQGIFSSVAAATPDSLLINGFVGRPAPAHPIEPTRFRWVDECTPSQIALLEEFIEECTSRGIRLMVFTPPVFGYSTECAENADLHQIEFLCDAYGVPYHDDSELPLFTSHAEWFADNTHLNHLGAIRYSALIAERCCNAPIE